MKDKIAGALYGMALGDAMGMPSELWGRKRVKQYFGKIEGFIDGPAENEVACNYQKGQFTDDTAQALVILDSIAATNFEPITSDIAARLLAWAEKENAFENNILGPTSKLALANYQAGIIDTKVTDRALSNGSAMRIAPIGCLFKAEQVEELAAYVYQISKVTHSSDVTIAGAAMIAMAVSSSIQNENFDEVLKDVYRIEEVGYRLGCETFSAKLSERLRIGLDIAQTFKGKDEEFINKLYEVVGSGVGIIESVPAALAIAYFAQDPNQSSLLCANMGGDTDTIGAMATAICGAFAGKKKIKQEYIDVLTQQNDVDFEYYLQLLIDGRKELS